MKITFSREEVEEIVLAHVRRAYGADLNHVDLSSIYSRDFATVTYEEPQQQELPVAGLKAQLPVAEEA